MNGAVRAKPADTDDIRIGGRETDTGIYDRDGRFSLTGFRRLFVLLDADGDGALDAAELVQLFARNRTGLIGHLISRAEFSFLLGHAGETRNGRRVLTSGILEEFYRGSLLYDLAAEVRARRLRDGPMSRDPLSQERRMIGQESR